MPGIYIHIPFCRKACSYCDFHFSTHLGAKAAVVNAIVKEMDLRQDYLRDKSVQSLYFGGGTPSLLSYGELSSIMEAVKKHYRLPDGAEITLEANPDDISAEALNDWKKVGVNRLSIGLQSFNDEELAWMNRAHNARQSEASVKLAQDMEFNNLTIDLIYGSKFQTLSSWEQTLEKAIRLNTQHISSYNLTIEEKTVLGLKQARGQEPAVNDELSSRQFLLMADALTQAGFEHYEISNFGKPGYFAKHNSNYWLQQPYLGLGPSAHSYNGSSRQWNVRNNRAYAAALDTHAAFFEKEELSLHDRYNEYILTRLRTTWGCDVKEMAELFGEELSAEFKAAVAEKKELVVENNGVYTLNLRGKLQADGIASDLFK